MTASADGGYEFAKKVTAFGRLEIWCTEGEGLANYAEPFVVSSIFRAVGLAEIDNVDVWRRRPDECQLVETSMRRGYCTQS